MLLQQLHRREKTVQRSWGGSGLLWNKMQCNRTHLGAWKHQRLSQAQILPKMSAPKLYAPIHCASSHDIQPQATENKTCRSANLYTPISHNASTNDRWSDCLFTTKCSAGKPWVWYSCWCHSDTHNQSKHCCRPRTPPHGNGTRGWQQQDNAPCHTEKNIQKAQSGDLAAKFPRSEPGRASVGRARTSPVHGSLTAQSTDLKGSSANTPVPDTARHPKRSCVRASLGRKKSYPQWGHYGSDLIQPFQSLSITLGHLEPFIRFLGSFLSSFRFAVLP